MGKSLKKTKLLQKHCNLKTRRAHGVWRRNSHRSDGPHSQPGPTHPKIDAHSTIDRCPRSSRFNSVRTTDNIVVVQDLIYSQNDVPHTHKSPREIKRQTNISNSSILRIASYFILIAPSSEYE